MAPNRATDVPSGIWKDELGAMANPSTYQSTRLSGPTLQLGHTIGRSVPTGCCVLGHSLPRWCHVPGRGTASPNRVAPLRRGPPATATMHRARPCAHAGGRPRPSDVCPIHGDPASGSAAPGTHHGLPGQLRASQSMSADNSPSGRQRAARAKGRRTRTFALPSPSTLQAPCSSEQRTMAPGVAWRGSTEAVR